MPKQTVWRYPGDSREDKLTRLMLTYRQALQDRDPVVCERIDTQARTDTMLAAKLPSAAQLDLDELMSDKDVASLVGISESTVRVWASRKLIKRYSAPDGSTRYLVSEVMEMYRQRRLRRVD